MVNFNSLTQAWTDNMRLDTRNAATQLNSTNVGSTPGTDNQQFWATPERFGDDDAEETMEIVLANEKLVNHLTFDLAKFPHDCDLEYFDVTVNDWVVMIKAETNNRERCRHSVLDCIPQILLPISAIDGHYHPHHSSSGHWESCEFLCEPVRFQRMRLVLRRHTRSRRPCNSRGVLVAYSLAIRNLYCGYKVYRRECVPEPQPILSSYTDHEEFATSTDVLGSQVSYSYRVNRASNVLLNEPDNNDGNALVWKSEPQPFPWAVVNYFMDVRDDNGDPQVLDRIYLDPLYDGANVNLYYSNDEPDTDFVAPNDPLPPQIAVVNGPTSGNDPLGSDSQPYGRVTWIDVDNTPICFRPGRRWWFGAHLNWKFLRTIDLLEHPIFDCGEFYLAWTTLGLRFASRHGDYFYVDVPDFHPATEFTFINWYDHIEGKVYIRIKVNEQFYYGSRGLSVFLSETTVSRMRIAGYFGDVSLSASFKLKHMVLKIDQEVTEELIENFLHNPHPYCVKPEFSTQDNRLTDNAILRYSPEFVTNDFPTGLKGGAPTKYSDMEWSPIARDYILRKGYLYFPPTKAKYWKLEFCSLTAEPYEVYVPIKKTVKTYRTEMWLVPVEPPVLAASICVLTPGVAVSVNVAASFNYRSSSVNVVTRGAAISVNTVSGPGGSASSVSIRAGSTSIQVNKVSGGGFSATSVRIVTNHHARRSLCAVNWCWGFLPCHPPVFVPRFETRCIHEYEQIEVEQNTKIAYFVGLKAIKAYKVSYLAVDDTNQYTELFHDKSNLDTDSGWVLTDDHELTSGDAHFAQAQSRIFPSNRVVRAVQFATTQSAPVQLLPDDDFDAPDPSTNWRSVGDGTLAPFTTTDQRVGSILRIDRSSREPSWSEMTSTLFPTWASISAVAATWDVVENSGNPAQAFGGIENTVAATTPPGGRIYAAARVVAPHDLAGPLYVQIVDNETGAVLSETSADVRANQITEWFTTYTIGEGGEVLAWRWRDFSTNPAYPTYVDNFQRANAANLGNLVTNQAWLNNGAPHSISSNEAVATGAGQFDYVDAVTPWGIYEVVVGAIGSGGTDKLFGLLPIQVDDQGVLAYIGGRSSLPATSIINRAVISGDDIRIDVLPTVMVPSGQRAADWVDNVSAPYSLVVYLNGVWVKTIGHRMGTRTRRSIMGKNGQHFRSFSALPYSYGPLPGPTLWELPVATMGNFDTPRLTWTSNIEGNIWATTGTVDNANVTTPGVLIFTSAASQMAVDTRYWYGTLGAGVRHVADGTIGKHGNVLVLDADAGLYLNYAGNIIQGATNFGNIIPGGVANNTYISIQFLDSKSVASSVRGSIDPNVYPRMLVARVAGTVVGTLAFTALQTMQGTRRGLAGDVYDGTPGATIADNHTSFDSFNWSPDASNVALSPQTPKWDEVSQKGTATYDSMAHFLTLNTGKLRARVIQRGPSIDVWDIDTLSLFADPIVWSFSNDGGLNFYNAYDIKNHPQGVLVFPEGVVLVAGQPGSATAPATPGQSLVWRVVSYAPNSKISSLTIRPWYGGLLSGITHRVGLAAGGPNQMPYDHYPPIEQDARFQTWHKPIPADWWYQFRILKRTVDQVVPPPKVLLLPDELTSFYHDEV